MFKSIRNSVSNLKERFFSEPIKLLDALALILMFGLGLGMEIKNALGYPTSPETTIHLTLAVLALMGLHFCIERFSVMNRMERRTAFLDVAGIKSISKAVQAEAEELMKFRNALRELESQTQLTNRGFGEIAVGFLKEHTLQLQGLAEGRLNLPRDWKIIAYQKLMNHYTERFDAVSEDDLNYWANLASDAEEYLQIAESSHSQPGTQMKMTRIFVLSLSDLDKTPRIEKVLRRQEQAGIGWAVAIRGEVPYGVKHSEVSLDFVLHNGNKAVSLSRRRGRRYETIFATHSPDTLRPYQETYKDLVPACWLVSQRFVDNYQGVLPDGSQDQDEIKNLAQGRNKKLAELNIKSEHEVFVLVVSQPEDTMVKIKKLVKLVNDYRRQPRRKVNYRAVPTKDELSSGPQKGKVPGSPEKGEIPDGPEKGFLN